MTPTPAERVERAKLKIAVAEAEVADGRRRLEETLLELHEEGLSYRELGDLAGFGKQYAGDLVLAARDRRDGTDGEDAA